MDSIFLKSREARKQALEWYNWLFYVEVLRLSTDNLHTAFILPPPWILNVFFMFLFVWEEVYARRGPDLKLGIT